MKEQDRQMADGAQPVTTGEAAQGSDARISRREMLALSGVGGVALALSQSTAASDTLEGRRGRPGLSTRLTREYNVQFPFVGAGMGFVAMPGLVAAVTNAGGIGVLGNGIEPPPGTQQLIRSIRQSTHGLFGVDFIFDNAATGPIVTDAHIDVCVAERVRLVVFHMNVPPKRWVDQLHAAGARVWMQAASVRQARDAAAIGIDAIIAQGSQAGGHNKSTTRTLKLVREIVDAVYPRMVLASGGIADGRAVVDALAEGAEGVWVGTRLVASVEAYAHHEYKRRIVEARGHATATTNIFGPEYPDRPYRVLRNRVVRESDDGGAPPTSPAIIGTTLLFPLTLQQPYSMPKLSAIVPTPDTAGDFEEMGLPAGEDSVKVIKRIQPAAQIVQEMMSEAQHLLRHRDAD
jgi:NAD(P)H-dependent flavin oxidoreductase YrpB (nitropropane dioxygenase family)